MLRAVAGLATVSCGCALASRLAIRALHRFFVLLAVPSKFCSSASIESITAIRVGGSNCSISSESSLSHLMSASVSSGSSCRSKAGHPSGPYRWPKTVSEFTMSIIWLSPITVPNLPRPLRRRAPVPVLQAKRQDYVITCAQFLVAMTRSRPMHTKNLTTQCSRTTIRDRENTSRVPGILAS